MSDSPFDQIRVLLIQARNTADMERQEQGCFADRTKLRKEQFKSVNVVREPLRVEWLDAVDAVMIGGAGEYSAMDNPAWMPALLRMVRICREKRIPTFGSCWGHQVIARALGGTVIHDKKRAELGCGKVHLTEAGQDDILFSSFPSTFNANMGHHDRVIELPSGAIELAKNGQPNQAFRLPDAPMYGTQFHSELDADSERERLIAYRDYYRDDLPDEAEFQAVLDGLAETTEVDHLLRDFLDVFVLKRSETSTAKRSDEAAT
ncbi:glutamine amidotransferase [Longibacter salinarum]|uniref:Glutamine amidotransferase n=1 Tax=Longibacter salinarum TaxID=1850348 RepID=A0A2A8D3F9_9BACT|nr:type 1 glutamine amidotransferase [Longibacter salinarum]PEN15168.1 glutamine amidotransferase [Longibacter salinarum]